jgi:hypothetical protein
MVEGMWKILKEIAIQKCADPEKTLMKFGFVFVQRRLAVNLASYVEVLMRLYADVPWERCDLWLYSWFLSNGCFNS